jgi:hypothetical protein
MSDTAYALSVVASVLFAVALLCAAVISASTGLSRDVLKWPRLRAAAIAAYAEPLIDLVQTGVVLGFGRASAASLASYSDALSWTLWHRQPLFAFVQTCERARSDFVVGYVFVALIGWAVVVFLFYVLKFFAPRVARNNSHALATAVVTSQLMGASMTLGAGAASECAIGVLLGVLMFFVVAAAALLPPVSAMLSIQKHNLVSYSSEVAQAEASKALSQAGAWAVHDQGSSQELQHWGFMLHMHTSASTALSSFIVRCCRRISIGITGGVTLAAAGARPTAPAAVVLCCCILEALHALVRRPNSSLGMNAATSLSLLAQFISACLTLAAADASSTSAADAAMWVLFISSIALSAATAAALFFLKPLCPDNWSSSLPQAPPHSSTDSSVRLGSKFIPIGPGAANVIPAAVIGSAGVKAAAANSSVISVDNLSGMSLTVSVLQFKQLLEELPSDHLRILLSTAGTMTFWHTPNLAERFRGYVLCMIPCIVHGVIRLL